MTSTPAIVTHGLTRRFGNRTAVDALTIEVPQGQIFGFLGPNGAGKTTTIRMLLGLTPATAGEAWILGHHFRRQRAAICRRVGAIVETPTFHRDLNAIDNLRVLSWTSGLHKTQPQLEALLDRVGLAQRGNDLVAGYSLGMKQRLGIASTLVHDPDLLFLDEPTNGLDPAGTQEMRVLLRSLADEGTTIFLSSHLLHEVEATCSRVLILHQGKVRLEGDVASLLRKKTCFYFKVQPVEQAKQHIIHANIKINTSDDFGIEISLDESDIPSLVRLLTTNGVALYRIEERRHSLEELFMQWTTEAQEQA